MYPTNHIQCTPNDERHDVVGFCSYYNHNFEQPPLDFACFNNAVSISTPSNPLKRSWPKKKRKSQTAVGGGRVVRVPGRKDRHSKVQTAKGLRDRRVRLAPTTAIPFYDVLDRLGFDRPSKALDWLLKKAKTAIDALEPQQSTSTTLKFCASTVPVPPEYSLSQHQPSNDHACLFSGFSRFVDEEAAPPPSAAALEAYLDPNGFCSALNSTPPILETNWEMARLQNLFTWNSVNESSGHASGGGPGAEYFPRNSLLSPYAVKQPILGHLNSGWEPLQSSIINYASSINDDFPEFWDELSKIADSAMPKLRG